MSATLIFIGKYLLLSLATGLMVGPMLRGRW